MKPSHEAMRFLVVTVVLLNGIPDADAFVNIHSRSVLPLSPILHITTNYHLGKHPNVRLTPRRSNNYFRSRKTVSLQLLNYHALVDPFTRGIAGMVAAGCANFILQWKTYSLIPVIASIVGWVTNYLAVKMSELMIASAAKVQSSVRTN
jgi:hypothetical protein